MHRFEAGDPKARGLAILVCLLPVVSVAGDVEARESGESRRPHPDFCAATLVGKLPAVAMPA
jgi:hypothetical protein